MSDSNLLSIGDFTEKNIGTRADAHLGLVGLKNMATGALGCQTSWESISASTSYWHARDRGEPDKQQPDTHHSIKFCQDRIKRLSWGRICLDRLRCAIEEQKRPISIGNYGYDECTRKYGYEGCSSSNRLGHEY